MKSVGNTTASVGRGVGPDVQVVPENCPKGRWKELAPMSLPEPRETLTRQMERFVTRNDPMLRRLDAVEQKDALVEMVEVGFPVELAEAVAEKLGFVLTGDVKEIDGA